MAMRKVTQPAEAKEAIQIVVTRRWLWQEDDVYYNEGSISVNIDQGGTLTIGMPDETTSYAPGQWRKIVSTHLNAPPAPPAPLEQHDHEH